MAVPTHFRTDSSDAEEMFAKRAARDQGLPTPERRAVVAMYAGLILTVIAVLVVIVDQMSTNVLSRHLRDVYAGYTASEPVESAIVAYLAIVGALGTVAWLWTIWAVRRQKRWTRPVATMLFLVASGLALVNLVVEEYGHTILPTVFGVVGVLPCVAGLVAVLLLWRRAWR